MPDVLEMNSDLMGPAGMELHTKEIRDPESPHDVGIGSGGPTGLGHGHALAVYRMPREGSLYGCGTSIEVPPR
jgi:hypothetical protein